MKCVDCGKDATKKDRDIGGGRCNSCYHPFVTEPLEDGLICKSQAEIDNFFKDKGL